MKTKSITTALLTLTMFLFVYHTLDACTGVMVKTKKGAAVHGRTLEFGVKVKTDIVLIPRKHKFVGKTAIGKGLSYTSKYAVAGIVTFGTNLIADGMNEKGLSCGAFYFPTYAKYAKVTKKNQKIALSSLDFNNWILTQFSTVEEVKQAIKNKKVVIVDTPLKGWGPTAPPFHYIVYDKSGKSIVIEPLDGILKVYDNPFGVFTNSPPFDWHMTNLRNYVNLTPNNVNTVKIFNKTIKQLGQGTGMMGIPGDFTPPSRFVRAVAFAATTIPQKSTTEGINQIFHILNNFDIPFGFSRETVKGKMHPDYTQLTIARDPQTLKLYYKTYEDQSIKVLDLKKFNFNAKNIMMLSTESKQPFVDVSGKLKPRK
ncbi:choloylglycine hydrolase family protein [bacterium]|nr:choloylglycine hydrolase family protein [bacterium]